jgi:pimeloyl-ACP methyl ester carboxylesterase
MKPVVFDKTVGWLHPAAGGRGVVIAGAHGFEDLCSRRFLTLMARQMAEAGLPVLQFDSPGCGDAPGDHTDPGRVAAWTRSIAAAIDQLKAETGVDDVLVIGFRLGALLAPAAIAGRTDVAGLALLAPPLSGKAYVREMTGLSRMIDAALPAQPAGTPEPFDGIEAAGFRLSAETVAELRTLEWRDRLTALPAKELLVMPSQITPAHAELAEQAMATGVAVRLKPFDGFSRLMSNPTANDIPHSTLAEIVEWAAQAGKPGKAESSPVAAKPPPMLEGDGYVEQPVVLGPSPEICGVLCLPAGALALTEIVLILNAGAIPHVGWARGGVEMARSLARRGIGSMRVDLPGLGQSEAPKEKRLFLYDARVGGDVTRILDWLEQAGFAQVCAAGICAGGYQSFHAARHDARIAHLAMVNPLCFSWNSSYALDMGLSKIRDNARDPLVGEPKEADAPGGKLKTSVSRLGKRILRRSMELSKSGLTRAQRLADGSVERWMQDLAASGTRVLVINSEGDLSLEEIARHFGPDGTRLKRIGGVTTALIAAADHTLTPARARAEVIDHLVRLLGVADAEREKPTVTISGVP